MCVSIKHTSIRCQKYSSTIKKTQRKEIRLQYSMDTLYTRGVTFFLFFFYIVRLLSCKTYHTHIIRWNKIKMFQCQEKHYCEITFIFVFTMSLTAYGRFDILFLFFTTTWQIKRTHIIWKWIDMLPFFHLLLHYYISLTRRCYWCIIVKQIGRFYIYEAWH